MKTRLLSTILSLSFMFSVTCAFGATITWTERTSSPSYFPYEVGTENEFQMDLPIPAATNAVFLHYEEGAGQWVETNAVIWSTTDPRYGEEGYWPLVHSAAMYLDGKYYVAGGAGPNINLAGLRGRNPVNMDVLQLGYLWPSNSWKTGEGYSYNRQAGFSIYDLASDTWESAKWDEPTGLTGYPINNSADPLPGTFINRQPRRGQGTWIGANQAFALEREGEVEFYLKGGYPIWDGMFAIYKPSALGGQGGWTTTEMPRTFSSGHRAQQYGGAVLVGSNVFVIGGRFWGPPGGTHMQSYNPYTGMWGGRYEDLLPGYELRGFGIAAVGTKIYLFSGYNQDEATSFLPEIFMIDVESEDTINEGIQIVGNVAIPVQFPSMISWNGILYVVGGRTPDGPTDAIQVFNPATEAIIVSADTLPFPAYGASCAVTPDGTFIFGGAMRMRCPVANVDVNSSRLFTAPMPEQDLFIAPTRLNFWQTEDTLQLRFDNVTGLDIVVTASTANAWISLDPSDGIFTVPASTTEYINVSVDRTGLSGPVTGLVTVAWKNKTSDTLVLLDTPRPDPIVTPTLLLTLGPATRSFTIENTGTVPMYFTNSSPDAFITDITPAIGEIPPAATETITFDVTAAAVRPGTGTVVVAYNSYTGEPEVVTVVNNPGNYYVSTTGDDSNDGMTPGTAWRTIAHGVNSMPQGDALNGPIVLNVAAGTYVDESTHEAGTNWLIDVSNRSYITIQGAGPEQSFLTREDATWAITFNNDSMPSMPVIRIFNANNVRVTGFTIIANTPPAITDGEGFPDHLAVIGVQNSGGIQLDHLYLDGRYHGQLYNTLTEEWQDSWEGWWYHAICVNGVIGPGDVRINNVLTRGFVRSVYNNNFGFGAVQANTNYVHIHHNTFVEHIAPTDTVQAVTVRVMDTEYGPSFYVRENIIGDMPLNQMALAAQGLVAQAIWSQSNIEYTLLSQSNQFWNIGLVEPRDAYKNINVIDELVLGQMLDFTNEVPVFFTAGGLPYSTDIDTEYGIREIGWNAIPEPALFTLLAGALGFLLLRRR